MGSSNPPGHGLCMYGNPYDAKGRLASIYTSRGRAKCKCDEMSPEYETQAERRQWHREHKRAATTAPEADIDEAPAAAPNTGGDVR